MIRKVKLADLVEDFSLYPRVQVDGSNVADIARAIQAGSSIPPIVADRKSLRIADGFHRRRAWLQVLGEDGEVEADLIAYKDETDLLRDAISRNATQGRRLDQKDRTRCVLLLERRGLTSESIAISLHTTVGRVEELRVRVVTVDSGSGDPEPVPVKPNAWPKAGQQPRTVTPEQADVLRSSSGWRTGQTVTQLTRELRSGAINVGDDPTLAAKFWDLDQVIREVVPLHAERDTA